MVVGVVALVVVGILKAAGWASDTVRQQNAQAAASAVHTTYAQPGDCVVSDLEVAATQPDEVAAGQGMTVSLTLTNKGSEACLIDTGSASLGAVITSGQDTVWTSATCPAGTTEHRLLVPAGETATASLRWDGHRTPTTCGEVGAEAGEGTYRIRLSLGQEALTDDRVFVVGASTGADATTDSGADGSATDAPTDAGEETGAEGGEVPAPDGAEATPQESPAG